MNLIFNILIKINKKNHIMQIQALNYNYSILNWLINPSMEIGNF